MNSFSLDCVELQDYQPNRYPFLMVDGISEVVPGKHAKGFKNLTMNEWYFPVHFPGAPNMPGALQLEALAQVFTIALTTQPGLKGKITHALGHQVRFKREVKPGEVFQMEVNVLSWNRGVGIGFGVGRIGNEVACEAHMTIAIPEILEQFTPKVSK
jgi:3-hydroxyacyl-[acyl-carrier-protein] dehydratase